MNPRQGSRPSNQWQLFYRRSTLFIAESLFTRQTIPRPGPKSDRNITVVCVSDTHTPQPSLPNGDLLLHAGDLSQSGSFEEIQAQLDWINAQPHKHKVVIADNHDILLDPQFVDRFPERILKRPDSSFTDLR